MKYFLILLVIFSFNSFASNFCNGGAIEKTVDIVNAMKAVDSFTYKQSDGFLKAGTAVYVDVFGKYKELKWLPDKGEGGFFILAFDILSEPESFYIMHGNNVRIEPAFYKGNLSAVKCDLVFEITENEILYFGLKAPDDIYIYISSRKSKQTQFEKSVEWSFFKKGN